MLKKIKRLLPGVFLYLLTVQAANAQADDININSPYSIQGLGEIQDEHFAMFKGWGNFSMGYRSNVAFTTRNPASYGALEFTNFSGGVKGRLSQFSVNGQEGFTQHVNLNALAIGVPLSKKNKWGMAFGLIPFSETSYRLQYRILDDTLSRREIFQGMGSLNRAFLGTGIEIFENFSAGINLSFLFGNTTHDHQVIFDPALNMYNLRQSSYSNITDFIIDAGLQYRVELGNNPLTLGLVADLPAKLNTRGENMVTTFFGSEQGVVNLDTISRVPEQDFKTSLPFGGGAGFTYQIGDRWIFGSDIYFRQWSQYNSGQAGDTLNDHFSVAAGFGYTPEPQSVKSYVKRITYRFGINYAQPYVTFNRQPLQDISVHAGWGLPLRRQGSSINLAIEAGRRTNKQADVLSEQFLRFNVGIVLNEQWFRRRHID